MADLRRLNPEDGLSAVFVAASQAAGDGGAGFFTWNPASQAADDDGCVIALDAGKPGRWQRVYSGPVDGRWFGARGDGQADDSDALQRAIDHHAEVHLPAGVYRLSRPLDIKAWGRRLSGAGQTANPGSPKGFESGRVSLATTLLLDADDAAVIRLAGSGHLVERLCLMAKTRQTASAANSYGIEINGVSRSRLSELRIFNCATGIGIPQRPIPHDRRANWMFDTTIANVDINNISRCGLDLRNFDGGGSGMVLSQIYIANFVGGTQQNPELLETEHFILGRNWSEYVLQAIHCEWALCRDVPIKLHNCNATIAGLHIEGLRFADGVPALIRTEGGYAGLTIDTMQLYECRIAGGPSAPPLSLFESAAKVSRSKLSSVRLANTNRSEGRKITAARIVGGAGLIDVSNMMQETDFYVPPRPANGLTVRD